MSRWDGHTARFDGISERHGILNRPFGANLLEDGRGRIWTKMYVYDPKADRLSERTSVEGANLGTGWFMSYDKTAGSVGAGSQGAEAHRRAAGFDTGFAAGVRGFARIHPY